MSTMVNSRIVLAEANDRLMGFVYGDETHRNYRKQSEIETGAYY